MCQWGLGFGLIAGCEGGAYRDAAVIASDQGPAARALP
jgi:hypothetical protein